MKIASAPLASMISKQVEVGWSAVRKAVPGGSILATLNQMAPSLI